MNRILPIMLALALAACTSPPMKPQSASVTGSTAPAARIAAYRVAVVKDLVIDDAALANVRGEDRAAVEAARAALIADFSARFRQDLAKRRYFESLVTEGAPANAVIIVPRALLLDPGTKTGAFTGTPTKMDILVSVSDAASGAALGSYTTPTQLLPKTDLPAGQRLQTYVPAVATRVGAGFAAIR